MGNINTLNRVGTVMSVLVIMILGLILLTSSACRIKQYSLELHNITNIQILGSTISLVYRTEEGSIKKWRRIINGGSEKIDVFDNISKDDKPWIKVDYESDNFRGDIITHVSVYVHSINEIEGFRERE